MMISFGRWARAQAILSLRFIPPEKCFGKYLCLSLKPTNVRASSTRSLRALRERVEEALTFVGLSDKHKYLPKHFSGGMKRRLNIACALAHRPKLIIMDVAEYNFLIAGQCRPSVHP